MKIKLTADEVYTSIVGLYDNIAKRLGYEDVRYDCKKIQVAGNIFEEVYRYYRDTQNMGQEGMGMMWCCYGPKCDESLEDNVVEIEDGFIIEEEAE